MDEGTWVQEHTRMVHGIARDVANRYRLRRHLDDLVSLGFEGLVEARKRYDEKQGADFATFAWYRVRGAMLDGSREMGWTSEQRTVHTEQIWVEHQAEQAQLETSGPSSKSRGRRASGGGGQPNDQKNQTTRLDELAGELDSIVQDAANIFILTTTTQGGWFDSKTASPEEKVFERELANHVRRCVEELDERSRQIVKMSFFESRSIYYIADELGLSPSWISRLRSQALEKLRTLLPGELVP